MENRFSGQGGILDRAAIALSGLCLVHCLFLPVFIAATPFLTTLDPGHLHMQMLILVVPVSLFAFALGFRRHRNRPPVAWGLVGLAVLVFGGTVAHARYGLVADTMLTVIGSLILAVAHYYNNRLTRHV